ncbi:hypothetical protein SDC9_23804 [bioreactor metagenome]|uniref:Uncharacterized protein n=1 Tax=bioreactor metagenome TaxID=1076179 RepID=A0A644UGI3_9ZZZZ
MIVLCGFAGTQKNRSADTEYRGTGKLFCSSGDLITGGAEKLQGKREKIRQKARKNPGVKRKKYWGVGLYASEEHVGVHCLCAEELFTECRGDRGCIFFAAEDIDIRCIGVVGEVSREERGLDELGH